MTSTGRNKMLVILVVVLFISNAVSLFYIISGNNEQKKTGDQKQVEFMRKELKLDDDQVVLYKALRSKRDSILAPLNDSLREAKQKMLEYLRQPAATVPDSAIWKAAEVISARQQKIEVAYYQHFRRMQAICRPEQLQLFDSVLVRMVNRTTGKQDIKKEKN